MKNFLAYCIIIFSSLILIIEIINDFSVLKTGYSIVFCENGFVKDMLIVNDYGSSSGTGKNSTSNFTTIYHGFLASNHNKASIAINNKISPFLTNYKDNRILVYHSKYTTFNLFLTRPHSIFELNLKYLLEPFFFLSSIFSILYLFFKKKNK
jgi:hypothetical protein